jgi:hypothetical protein
MSVAQARQWPQNGPNANAGQESKNDPDHNVVSSCLG